MIPPRYEALTADGADLAQEAPPSTDQELTQCIACGSAVALCGCNQGDRVQAARIVHQELEAGRDARAALHRWRLTLRRSS